MNAFINVCETTSKASSDSLRLFDHLAECGSEIFGEAVAGLFANNVAFFMFDVDLFGFESVLTAVGFISYDDNVGAIANLGINGFVILGREFLYGGEDNATRIYVEQFPHCLAIARLLGGLTSQLTAPGEGIEKLVVEV
ncbi:MAG TPA: hypothetical protein V6D12_20950, partial [Candidatus Obscuribacterales bacterium]